MTTKVTAQKYYPQIDKSVPAKVMVHLQRLYEAINDHDQAIVTLNGKLTGTAATTAKSSAGIGAAGSSSFATTIINQVGVSSFNTLTGTISYFPYLGRVNPQTGVAAYTTQQSDAGQEIVLGDASPIAVTLNFNVTAPWFTTISNQGTGTATITPSQGTINGGAAITLPGGSWATIYFDGVNFWSDSPGTTVGGVTQLLAGAGISLNPAGGTGVVIITNTGGGGGGGGINVVQNAGLISNDGTSGSRQFYQATHPLTTPPVSPYVYQNTNTGPLLVTVSADGGGGGFFGAAYCDASSTPTTTVSRFSRVNDGSSNPNFYPGSMTFIVAPSYYYGVSVTNSGGVPVGANAMDSWTEILFSSSSGGSVLDFSQIFMLMGA